MQSLGQIVQRTPAVGAKMWLPAGIVFTHRPKIRFFAPQGQLVAPIQVKRCRTDGHLGPLGRAKFDIIVEGFEKNSTAILYGWDCRCAPI